MNIKRLILVMILFFSINAVAQNDFSIGVKAGVNISGFNVDGTASFEDAFGYHAGIMGEYIVIPNLSLQPEIVFIKKTGGRETSENLSSGVISSDLYYVDIPLMAKYYPLKGFAIEIGPQLDVLISDKTRIGFNEGNEPPGSFDIETNTFQLSASGGMSYKFLESYILQFRYSHGLSDVYEDLNAKNSVFSFSLGYFFD